MAEVAAPAAPTTRRAGDFADWGIEAFTTTRAAGTYGLAAAESAGDVFSRWNGLQARLVADGVRRLATAHQVHGGRVLSHDGSWEGWLRALDADGHFAGRRGTGMAVTVADCVPAFLAHPSGAVALLHSGWRGTEARIVEAAIALFAAAGMRPSTLRLHLGPAICGRCYEVSPDVYGRLTGRAVDGPTSVDLRGLIADHAAAAGVRDVGVSEWCTRCDNAEFFSHRAGDAGRQLGVMYARG